MHDTQLVKTMTHLVNHSTNTFSRRTPMHAHQRSDAVDATRARKRLRRIEKLKGKVYQELATITT
jgi:hypothetical protein